MKQEYKLRQLDLISEEAQKKQIMIIGAGAIGSCACLALAKSGYENITVYDFDKVEAHNMSNQFYPIKAIGKYKVQALAQVVKEYTGTNINPVPTLFDASKALPSNCIVLSCVDSMGARVAIKDALRASRNWSHLIDARMGAELYALYIAQNSPESIADYTKSLYSDSEALAERCTSKSTMYCALSVGAEICSQVKKISSGALYSRFVTNDMRTASFISCPMPA